MTWYQLESERLLLYSQIGIILIDDFTAGPPRYPVSANVEVRDTAGDWHQVERMPVITPSGTITFPGLGRSAHVATQPVLRYRVTLESEFYRPEFLINSDGIEFDIHPYDDATPPAVIPTNPQIVLMLPNTKYGYPGNVRLVKGVVQDGAADPVANVEITEGSRERVLTDERGAFSLPLRWPALNASVTIDALDHRMNRSDSQVINLPGELSHGHLFTI